MDQAVGVRDGGAVDGGMRVRWWFGLLSCWVLWVSHLLVVDFGSWVCGFHMGLCLIWVLYGFPICGGGV